MYTMEPSRAAVGEARMAASSPNEPARDGNDIFVKVTRAQGTDSTSGLDQRETWNAEWYCI